MPSNKHSRRLAADKVIQRRATALKLGKAKDLPLKTRQALADTGNIRLPKGSPKKSFGKSTGKRYYGHFSGMSQKGHSPKRLKERAAARDSMEFTAW
jgi:hypothetical protein